MNRHDLPPATKERLRKVEALVARGATPGERAAAVEARNRIYRTHGIDPAAPGQPEGMVAREMLRREFEEMLRRKAEREAAKRQRDAQAERSARRDADATFLNRKSNQALLGLIRLYEEGVRLETIAKTFGWQPHTARAAISRLRKAGAPVSRSEAGFYRYGGR